MVFVQSGGWNSNEQVYVYAVIHKKYTLPSGDAGTINCIIFHLYVVIK